MAEYPEFTMSMFAKKEDLLLAKAQYFERLSIFLDQKIEAASQAHPVAVPFLLLEAIDREGFMA